MRVLVLAIVLIGLVSSPVLAQEILPLEDSNPLAKYRTPQVTCGFYWLRGLATTETDI